MFHPLWRAPELNPDESLNIDIYSESTARVCPRREANCSGASSVSCTSSHCCRSYHELLREAAASRVWRSEGPSLPVRGKHRLVRRKQFFARNDVASSDHGPFLKFKTTLGSFEWFTNRHLPARMSDAAARQVDRILARLCGARSRLPGREPGRALHEVPAGESFAVDARLSDNCFSHHSHSCPGILRNGPRVAAEDAQEVTEWASEPP